MDEGADDLVLTGIANDIQASEEGHGRKHGVRAVQEGHLALVVWRLVVSKDDMQSGFVGRELTGELLYGEVGRGLYDPEVEGLSLHHHLVCVAHLLLDGIDVLAREARNDAIDQSGADITRLFEPRAERIVVGGEILFPQFDVLADTIDKMMTILEDELARHYDKALLRIAVERAEAVVEQLRQFGGIGRGRCVRQAARGVEGYASLRGVGDDEANVGLCSQSDEGLVILVWIEGAADAVNEFK